MKFDIRVGKSLILTQSFWDVQIQQQMAKEWKGKLFEIVPFQDIASGIPFALELREYIIDEKKEIKKNGKEKKPLPN